MTQQDRTFSATNPPDEDDIDGLIEWAKRISQENQEFVEREKRQIRYNMDFPDWDRLDYGIEQMRRQQHD